MVACAEAARLLGEPNWPAALSTPAPKPCAMCAAPSIGLAWAGVVFASPETGLMRYTGTHEQTPPSTCPAAKSSPADKTDRRRRAILEDEPAKSRRASGPVDGKKIVGCRDTNMSSADIQYGVALVHITP